MLETAFEPALAAADILIVDDNPENLKILLGILSTTGCRVRPAPSGSLALRAAREEPPDLILLDIQMPGMDGYEVCRFLKADPRLAPVPVIFLSAFTDPGCKVRAFEAGGVDYVTKPFAVEEVLARVGTHLRLRRECREREEACERQRELERQRDGLVHMLVHDLRSPLLALNLILPGLKEEVWADLPADSRVNLDEALRSVAHLIRMVNAVLDVSRLETGRMRLEPVALDLGQLGREALASLQALGERHTLSLDAPEPVRVRADRELLFRVFQNLLGNAFRHTRPSGEVQVRIRREQGWACATVADNGPGLSEEVQARVFQKFGHAGVGERGAPGLGLPFCKLAMEAMGGTITVESAPGAGCAITVKLPEER